MEMEKEYFTIISRRLGFKLLLSFLTLEMGKTEFQQFTLLTVQDWSNE